VRVLVATKPVDFRRGADSLAALVREQLRHDPFSGTIFIFRSKRADRLKILAWDGSGLMLFWKRLEQGAQWPIHRVSAPANDAVRLPGARRLERQMTVTDGRAGHFRTVSAVVRVRPGPSVKPLGIGQEIGVWLMGDNPRLDPIHGDGFPLAGRKALHRPPLRLSNFGPTSCGLRPHFLNRVRDPFISSPST
jgi:transposase